MPNGNNDFRRVEAVVFDAMHTIFQPKVDADELNAQVYREIVSANVDAAALAKYIHVLRTLLPRRAYESLDDYWAEVNMYALRHFWSKKYRQRDRALQIGRRIHRRILSDTTLYVVTDAMRETLEWLKEQDDVRVVLASNQDRETLDEHLHLAGLNGFFGEDVFTADEVGYSKHDHVFWETIRKSINIEQFISLAHVGNSVESDTELAKRHGVQTALLDFQRKIDGVKISGVTIVHSEAELRIWLEYLLSRHENGHQAIANVASALVDAQANGNGK